MISPAPSGYVKIAIENGPVEIVDLPSYKIVIFHSFPIKNGDFPQFFLCLPEGISN